MGGIYDIGHYYLIFDMNESLVDSMSSVDCHDRGGGTFLVHGVTMTMGGTFLVHGVTMTMGGEFGCLIVLITPLGRVGRRDALGADLSIVSSTDWQA